MKRKSYIITILSGRASAYGLHKAVFDYYTESYVDCYKKSKNKYVMDILYETGFDRISMEGVKKAIYKKYKELKVSVKVR